MTLGEASLLERLAADEKSVRGQLESLREQVAALEEQLKDLATAQRIVAPILAGHSQPEQPLPDGTPDAPTHASSAGAAPTPKPVAGLDKQVVVIMASSGRTMRAKEVAQALGEPDVRGRVETTRARLKRLTALGWLTQHEPGLFSIAAGINGHALGGVANDEA
ncbi:hypothetical protein ACIBO2_23670 [Nonomuraea sp. NPDC050022]|uniref:hypothetical protein n=1 Tax=unclassified Nonomuraea TaxID=2593643 RepID=UPI0033E61D48